MRVGSPAICWWLSLRVFAYAPCRGRLDNPGKPGALANPTAVHTVADDQRRQCRAEIGGRRMNDLPLRPAADIGAVEDRFFTLRDFPLAGGTVMPEARIAYETYGRLAPLNGPNGGRNAILCTHGYTGSHH